MSRKLFRHSIVSNVRAWDLVTQVDAVEAEPCRPAGWIASATGFTVERS